MGCGVRVEADRCLQDARWEVRFGGLFNVLMCDEHLSYARRFAAGWGKTEDFEGLVHAFHETPPELPVGAPDWERGKASGRRWATDEAEGSEVKRLADLLPNNPSMTRASRCLNIAHLLNPTDAVGWPTLQSWLKRDPPPSLNWLAGFVDGALEVLEKRSELPAI
jgi:hypothetical protein